MPYLRRHQPLAKLLNEYSSMAHLDFSLPMTSFPFVFIIKVVFIFEIIFILEVVIFFWRAPSRRPVSKGPHFFNFSGDLYRIGSDKSCSTLIGRHKPSAVSIHIVSSHWWSLVWLTVHMCRWFSTLYKPSSVTNWIQTFTYIQIFHMKVFFCLVVIFVWVNVLIDMLLLTTADDSIGMGNMLNKMVIDRMKQSE